MRPDLLTPWQKKVLEELFRDRWFKRHFYLTGGTALSGFHLFHRYSDDLDFFTHEEELTPVAKLMQQIQARLKTTVRAEKTAPGFQRYVVADSLQVDFVKDVPFRVGSPELIDGFMVDSLKNIAVNKVTAILGRLDPKDYVDLFFLIKQEGFEIEALLQLGRQKDAGLEAFVWASLVGEAQPLPLLPRMVKKLELKTLEKFYLKLRDTILDGLGS